MCNLVTSVILDTPVSHLSHQSHSSLLIIQYTIKTNSCQAMIIFIHIGDSGFVPISARNLKNKREKKTSKGQMYQNVLFLKTNK